MSRVTFWSAEIDRPSDRVILHLHGGRVQADGVTELRSPAEVKAFLEAHPEVEAVNVYDGDFPRQPVPRAHFGESLILRLFARGLTPTQEVAWRTLVAAGRALTAYELRCSPRTVEALALAGLATRQVCGGRRTRYEGIPFDQIRPNPEKGPQP